MSHPSQVWVVEDSSDTEDEGSTVERPGGYEGSQEHINTWIPSPEQEETIQQVKQGNHTYSAPESFADPALLSISYNDNLTLPAAAQSEAPQLVSPRNPQANDSVTVSGPKKSEASENLGKPQEHLDLNVAKAVSSEPLISSTKIKEQLRRFVNDAYNDTCFAWQRTLKYTPNPGLQILPNYDEQLRSIGFPLSPQDISRIKSSGVPLNTNHSIPQEGQKSPSRGGVWEIPAHKWATDNPSWDLLLNLLWDNIHGGLEIAAMENPINLSPASLILYEPGSTLSSAILTYVDGRRML